MNCLIIEDEPLAAQRLARLIKDCRPDIEIKGILHSITDADRYLSSHEPPDLLLMDIQLGDGLSFDILENNRLKVPVIFTTAYDEYAIKAFRVNSIDYLLKPIDKEELQEALTRAEAQFGKKEVGVSAETIAEAIRQMTGKYKERFVVRIGERLQMIQTNKITCFVSSEKATFACMNDGRHIGIDYTLEQLEGLVSPDQFFRISRQHMISLSYIHEVIIYSGSRLKVVIRETPDQQFIVSRERCSKFKEWLGQEG